MEWVVKQNVKRIRSGITMLDTLKRREIYCGKVTSSRILKIWQRLILPKVCYAVQTLRLYTRLAGEWSEVKMVLMVIGMGFL